MTTPSKYQFPAQPEKNHIGDLEQFLIDNIGKNIELNADGIETFTGHQMELVLSGYSLWEKDGHEFTIVRCPEDIMARLTNVGMPTRMFSEGS